MSLMEQRKKKIKKQFVEALDNNDFMSVASFLMDKSVDLFSGGAYACAFAAGKCREHVLTLLLFDGRADPSVENNLPIRQACEGVTPRIEMVKLLLLDERVDPTDHNNSAIDHCRDKQIAKLLYGHGASYNRPIWRHLRDHVKDWKWNHSNFEFYPVIIKRSVVEFLLVIGRYKKEFQVCKDIKLLLVSYIIKVGVNEWLRQRKERTELKKIVNKI